MMKVIRKFKLAFVASIPCLGYGMQNPNPIQFPATNTAGWNQLAENVYSGDPFGNPATYFLICRKGEYGMSLGVITVDETNGQFSGVNMDPNDQFHKGLIWSGWIGFLRPKDGISWKKNSEAECYYTFADANYRQQAIPGAQPNTFSKVYKKGILRNVNGNVVVQNGQLVDAVNNNPILDSNNNPIGVDQEGRLIDNNNQLILDNGKPVFVCDVLAANEVGIIADYQGIPTYQGKVFVRSRDFFTDHSRNPNSYKGLPRVIVSLHQSLFMIKAREPMTIRDVLNVVDNLTPIVNGQHDHQIPQFGYMGTTGYFGGPRLNCSKFVSSFLHSLDLFPNAPDYFYNDVNMISGWWYYVAPSNVISTLLNNVTDIHKRLKDDASRRARDPNDRKLLSPQERNKLTDFTNRIKMIVHFAPAFNIYKDRIDNLQFNNTNLLEGNSSYIDTGININNGNPSDQQGRPLTHFFITDADNNTNHRTNEEKRDVTGNDDEFRFWYK